MDVLWIARCSSRDKPIARAVAYNRLHLRQFYPAQLSHASRETVSPGTTVSCTRHNRLVSKLGRVSDTNAVFGRVSYAQRPPNVQLSPEKSASVQIRPESAASVRMSPGGAGGVWTSTGSAEGNYISPESPQPNSFLSRGSKKPGTARTPGFSCFWSQRQESNPQPADYKSAALPLSHAGV